MSITDSRKKKNKKITAFSCCYQRKKRLFSHAVFSSITTFFFSEALFFRMTYLTSSKFHKRMKRITLSLNLKNFERKSNTFSNNFKKFLFNKRRKLPRINIFSVIFVVQSSDNILLLKTGN